MDKQKDNFTNWTHTSYEKIPESPNNWKLTESDFRAFKKTAWVVTEKIHGANFCIVTDGSEVRFAKRKEFLQPDIAILILVRYRQFFYLLLHQIDGVRLCTS